MRLVRGYRLGPGIPCSCRCKGCLPPRPVMKVHCGVRSRGCLV